MHAPRAVREGCPPVAQRPEEGITSLGAGATCLWETLHRCWGLNSSPCDCEVGALNRGVSNVTSSVTFIMESLKQVQSTKRRIETPMQPGLPCSAVVSLFAYSFLIPFRKYSVCVSGGWLYSPGWPPVANFELLILPPCPMLGL